MLVDLGQGMQEGELRICGEELTEWLGG